MGITPAADRDIVIRGGIVVDGTGGPSRRADIRLRGDTIDAIADAIPAGGGTVVDAAGAVVAPGFVDIHSHADVTILRDPRGLSSLAQGVTTVVVGNCGHGPAPLADPAVLPSIVFGYGRDLDVSWSSFAGYLDAIREARPAINVAALAGHHALRAIALEHPGGRADARAVRSMAADLDRALDEGAFGLSLGLEYPLGRPASSAELRALADCVRSRDRLLAIHTRNRDLRSGPALVEAFAIARRSGARTQISHLVPRFGAPTGTTANALAAMDSLRRAGLDIACDQHTRLHGLTKLTTMLPTDLAVLEGRALASELSRAVVRRRVRAYRRPLLKLGLQGAWDRLALFHVPGAPELEGEDLASLAHKLGCPPIDIIIAALRAAGADAQEALILGRVHSEEDLAAAFEDPWCAPESDATTLATDGPLASERFLGAYTWAASFLRRFVRARRLLSLEEAVRRMTSLPASRLGLVDRGRLRVGDRADVVVLDPDVVAEQGTLRDPNHYPLGIHAVVVNGALAWARGGLVGPAAGRVLTPGR